MPLAAALQHYRATTHTCSPLAAPGLRGPAAALRTCVFRNLYLYNGRAYYLSDGVPPLLVMWQPAVPPCLVGWVLLLLCVENLSSLRRNLRRRPWVL